MSKLANQTVSPPEVVVREARRQDVELLVDLGKRSFYEAFAEMTDSDDLTAYSQSTFSYDQIKMQLVDRDSQYLIIEHQSDPLGYAYIYPTRPPACSNYPGTIQLIRFYLLKKCYGQGIGDALMRACLEKSGGRGYRKIWLSSWELNGRANTFYKRWQFKIVGRQKFVVGRDVQNDYIFMRDI